MTLKTGVIMLKYSFDHKLHVKIHLNGKMLFEIVIFHNISVFKKKNQIKAFCYLIQCHSDICNPFLSVQMLFRVIVCSYSMGHSLLMHKILSFQYVIHNTFSNFKKQQCISITEPCRLFMFY